MIVGVECFYVEVRHDRMPIPELTSVTKRTTVVRGQRITLLVSKKIITLTLLGIRK